MTPVATGALIAGFRVERLIGAGSTGKVYEAAQPSLGRTVALRVIDAELFATAEELARFDDQQRRVASLHHPNLVPCYAFGEWSDGRFVAMRLIRGRRLAELLAAGSPIGADLLAPLEDALRSAHEAGVVHGRISAENVLIGSDGTPYLADLGLGHDGSSDDDRHRLAALISRVRAHRPVRRGRVFARPALALIALAGAGLAAFAFASGGGESEGPSIDPLGCRDQPSANTPSCTLAQTTLDGREQRVPRAGVIRSWVVRGATGELALQVIRERRGRSFVVGFSQPERLLNPAPQVFAADIGVKQGDRIAIRLGPGASVGSRLGSGGSAVVRWDGALTADPRRADATTREVELLLRAEIEFGERPSGPRQLQGAAAATAPPGRILAETVVVPAAGRAARVAVVALSGGIALDLLRGRRLARLEIPDADPAGELLEIAQSCGPVGARGFCIRWRNPGEELPLQHEYLVRKSMRIELAG